MCGLFSNLILQSATAGFSNYSMGYINSYFSETKVDEWRLLKNKIIFTLTIFMRFLLVGVIFSFLMMIFRFKEYPPKEDEKKDKKTSIELSEK